ncbi:MAG TPA: outer membrane beta-barrel protein [Bacteroidia bacterium]|jgi:hypothetical protein|nr:outer membrane beta-barrel protein [Bacteroidia bacterium]
MQIRNFGKQVYFNISVLIVLLFSSNLLRSQNPSPPAYFKETNIVGIGVGFGGGLGGPGISYDLLPGYTGTMSPGIMATYELKFDRHWGIGLVMSFSSATYTNDNMTYVLDSAGSKYNKTFTDKITATYIGLAGKAYYHFGATGKFDPYGALILGYTFTLSSSNTTYQQVSYPSSSAYPGILVGVAVGARVFLSKKIGIWAEVGYSGVPDYLFNAGIAYNLVSKL